MTYAHSEYKGEDEPEERGTNPMKKLKVLRTIAGFSQWDLTAKTGIPAYRISLFETGRIKPKSDELKTLSDALGVTPKVLLDEDTIIIKDGQVVTQNENE